MEPVLTTRQAFEAMRRFLAQFNEREPDERKETIDQILRWTETESDGGTFDPAQWDDWTSSVRSVLDEQQADGAPLRATYDSEADAAYVYLTARPLASGRDSIPLETPEGIQAMVVLDWRDGRITGLEVLDARSLLHDDLIDQAERLS